MNHRMAIRANRTKIANRVKFIPFLSLRKWSNMVNMDKAITYRSIALAEQKAADNTFMAVVCQANCAPLDFAHSS